MDEFENYQGLGDTEYVDAEETVEYVSTDSDNITYIDSDEGITSGTDFDYAQTVPENPAVPYDAPMSQEQIQFMKDLNQEYPPTSSIGVAQDAMNLLKTVSQGSPKQSADALSQFSEAQLKRFTSPKVVGPILLFWAFRGKLSYVERAMIGVIGVGALVRGFGGSSKPVNNQYAHPLMTVKPKSVSTSNLSGRY